jgi:hypothetical protein
MKRFLGIGAVVLLTVLTMYSCKKKDNPEPEVVTGNGSVKIELANKVGTSSLNLNDQWYQNDNGDSFKVTKFNYYISNIILIGTDCAYTETEGYHLVQQSDAASMVFDLASVPYGKYTGISFMIGVDSLHNVSGAQTGALDPVNGMFWSWSTGYIMFKMEGNSPKSPEPAGALIFHAGGYKGANAVQRMVTFNFPAAITVGKTGENHIHLEADVLKVFKAPTMFDFSTMYTINTGGVEAKKLADNYATMFTLVSAGL